MLGIFSLFNWKRLLIEVAVVGSLLAIGYWYFNFSQAKIAALESDKAKLTVAVDVQKKTIDSLQKFMSKQAQNLTDLQKELADAESERAKLAAKLAKHDLEELARKKPGLIENIINQASNKEIQDLKNMTRSKK
jgi:hypothetical protein